MDRFKFRGKRVDNGEWVVVPYGEKINYISGESKPCIQVFTTRPDSDNHMMQIFETEFIEVIPKTVGQCTGLHAAKSYRGTDPDDLLIWEGDVVIWNDGGGELKINPQKGWIRKAIVSFKPELCFVLTHDTPSGTPEHKFGFSNFIYTETDKHIRIIGTIHD